MSQKPKAPEIAMTVVVQFTRPAAANTKAEISAFAAAFACEAANEAVAPNTVALAHLDAFTADRLINAAMPNVAACKGSVFSHMRAKEEVQADTRLATRLFGKKAA
jgi:hypothetical protein